MDGAGTVPATSMTQYRTGQQSLTAAAKGVAYSVKSIREWYAA